MSHHSGAVWGPCDNWWVRLTENSANRLWKAINSTNNLFTLFLSNQSATGYVEIIMRVAT